MAFENLPRTSFAGGELSPEMDGRVDLPIYSLGCRVLENCLLTKTGGARKRPGWERMLELTDPAFAQAAAPEPRLVAVPGVRGAFSLVVFGHHLVSDGDRVVAMREFPVVNQTPRTIKPTVHTISSVDPPSPGVPTGLLCHAGNMFIRLTFSRVPGATDYDHRFRRTGMTLWTEVVAADDFPDPEIVVMGLENDAEYEFQVRARAPNADPSGWSVTARCAPNLVASGTPENLNVEAPPEGGLRITYDRVLGAATYQVRIRAVADPSVPWNESHELAQTRSLIRTRNDLLAGQQYEVQVRSWNTEPSAWSDSVFGTPISGAAPQTPMEPETEVTGVSRGKANVKLTWPTIEGAEHYGVRYRTDQADWVSSVFILAGSGSTQEATVEGLTVQTGLVYYFQVRAGRGDLFSDFSVAAVTHIAPAVPTELRVTGSEDRRDISWREVMAAERYTLERSVRGINGFWRTEIEIYRGADTGFTDYIPRAGFIFTWEVDARYRVAAFIGAVRSDFTDWSHDPQGRVG